MTTDLENRVKDLLHSVDVQPPLVDPTAVVARGHRVQRIRRRRRALGGIAGLCVAAALGVVALNVPATGHPLSTTVWAAGPSPLGSGTPTMTVNGHRFVASIRESRLDHRRSWVTSRMLDNGEVKDMGSTTDFDVNRYPQLGMRFSNVPGVIFGLFPAGTTDVVPVFKGSVDHQVSTMRINSPWGAEYVAVTVATSNPDDLKTLRGAQWVDASGQTKTYLPFDKDPLQDF